MIAGFPWNRRLGFTRLVVVSGVFPSRSKDTAALPPWVADETIRERWRHRFYGGGASFLRMAAVGQRARVGVARATSQRRES